MTVIYKVKYAEYTSNVTVKHTNALILQCVEIMRDRKTQIKMLAVFECYDSVHLGCAFKTIGVVTEIIMKGGHKCTKRVSKSKVIYIG